MSRFVVTELEGFAIGESTTSRQQQGLTCHVLDTHANHRLLAMFRSEDYRGRGRSHAAALAAVREAAGDYADRLNRGAPPQQYDESVLDEVYRKVTAPRRQGGHRLLAAECEVVRALIENVRSV